RSFTYDENGNLTSNGEATFTWTSFHKVRTVTPTGGPQVRYEYDANQLLVRRSAPQAETFFLHDWDARNTTAPGTEHRFRIFADGRLIAEVLRAGTGPQRALYYHEDHLGSVDAVTDSTGALVERHSYDAFGKPRAPNWTQATAPMPTRAAFG